MRPSMRALAVVVALALVVGCSDDADTADTTQSAEPIGPEVAGIDFGILDLPPGDPYEGYMVVGDDTGVFELEVPEDWSFLTTEPVPWGMFPFVQASAVEPEFKFGHSDFDTPGVLAVIGGSTTEQRALDRESRNLTLEENCEAMEAFDYDDGTYTGVAGIWTGCGPDQVGELVISMSEAEGDPAVVAVQLHTQADIDAATQIIETFSFKSTSDG